MGALFLVSWQNLLYNKIEKYILIDQITIKFLFKGIRGNKLI